MANPGGKLADELEKQIAELEKASDSVASREEIDRLRWQLEAARESSEGAEKDAWARVLLARHPRRAFDGPATFDHTTAEAGPDDHRDRRSFATDRPEVLVMRVERRCVGVVVVEARQAEFNLERCTEVEPLPIVVREVGTAARRDHTPRRRRPRRIEAHPEYLATFDARHLDRGLEGLAERTDRSCRPLGHTTWQLDQTIDQEAPVAIHDRELVRRAAVVEPDHVRTRAGHAATEMTAWFIHDGDGLVARITRR